MIDNTLPLSQLDTVQLEHLSYYTIDLNSDNAERRPMNWNITLLKQKNSML